MQNHSKKLVFFVIHYQLELDRVCEPAHPEVTSRYLLGTVHDFFQENDIHPGIERNDPSGRSLVQFGSRATKHIVVEAAVVWDPPTFLSLPALSLAYGAARGHQRHGFVLPRAAAGLLRPPPARARDVCLTPSPCHLQRAAVELCPQPRAAELRPSPRAAAELRPPPPPPPRPE